jgi:hypothetical protein
MDATLCRCRSARSAFSSIERRIDCFSLSAENRLARRAELSTPTAMQMIAITTMTPIGISKRTRAWSQRDRFVSAAVCICAEGNTLPPLDISVGAKIASKSLPMTCNLHGNHGRQEPLRFRPRSLTAGKRVALALEQQK